MSKHADDHLVVQREPRRRPARALRPASGPVRAHRRRVAPPRVLAHARVRAAPVAAARPPVGPALALAVIIALAFLLVLLVLLIVVVVLLLLE